MPVLGVGGVVELRRELPPPIVIGAETARHHVDGLEISENGYWGGDKIWIWGPKGLPFDLNRDGRPDTTGGFGMFFGSRYGLYGSRAARLTSGASKWFGSEPPFQTQVLPGIQKGAELFISRDSLDRISFYLTLEAALDASPANKLKIFPVDFDKLLLAPVGSTGYRERLQPAYSDVAAFRFEQNESEALLTKITDKAVPEPIGDEDDRPWRFVGQMDEWSLELSSSEVDTTALGQGFNEGTRALVSGGGRLSFFVDRLMNDQSADTAFLARLLILLEQGCKAEASFKLAPSSSSLDSEESYGKMHAADLSYRAELLLVRTAVDTRFDDAIRGGADFVTIGRIKLVID